MRERIERGEGIKWKRWQKQLSDVRKETKMVGETNARGTRSN
jgi:hypothetical protein